MKLSFKACKHLNFAENFPGCKRQLLSNDKVFWMRPKIYEGQPLMVQFCKLRGRLNNPVACLCESCARCGEYKDHEHIIEIESSELEGITQ